MEEVNERGGKRGGGRTKRRRRRRRRKRRGRRIITTITNTIATAIATAIATTIHITATSPSCTTVHQKDNKTVRLDIKHMHFCVYTGMSTALAKTESQRKTMNLSFRFVMQHKY